MIGWEERMGAAGVAIAAMLGTILLADVRRSYVARYLLGFYVGMASYYLVPLTPGEAFPVWARALLFILRLSGLYFLWRTAQATFRDDFVPDKIGPITCAIALTSSIAAIVTVNRTGLFSGLDVRSRELTSGIVAALWALVFISLAVREALRGWSSDMVDSRRNFRRLLTGAVALSVLLIIVLRFSAPVASTRPLTLTVGLLLVFTFSAVFLRARDELLGRATRRKYITDESLVAKLEAAMDEQFIYREEGMTIRKLARLVNEPEYRLRLHINNGLGFRNFNRFLNSYRIREACTILSDPSMREMTVLRVSLDLGFGSISSFNKAFREIVGMTPTRFRAQFSAKKEVGKSHP